MAIACDENKVWSLFGRSVQAPGGCRTSLSPNARKSVASFEELRDVLSLAVYNSAVLGAGGENCRASSDGSRRKV